VNIFQGRNAVVTGAASGIGRATAVALSQQGCRVAASDVDETGLAETMRMLAGDRGQHHQARLDVADREAVEIYAEQIEDAFGSIHIVVNNAGVALIDTIEQMRYDDFEWLFQINFWGVVHGTKAFLPYLKRAGWGRIVNVASVFGLIAVPTQGAYNASKFAVRGFTEALQQELALADSSVQAHCVLPGGINTNIARRARVRDLNHVGGSPDEVARHFAKLARTSPERAAETILDGMRKNRPRILIGKDAKLIETAVRLLPIRYQQTVVNNFRRRRQKRAQTD